MKKNLSYSKKWIIPALFLGFLLLSLSAFASTDSQLILDQETYVEIGDEIDIQWFVFTPDETGDYIFSSIGNAHAVGALFEADFTEISSNNYGGQNRNFQLICELTAGTLYRFSASGNESFHVLLSKYNNSSMSGENWTLNNGMLTFFGTEPIPEYEAGGAPWYDQYVSSVVIGNGISRIPDFTFSELKHLSSVNIPDSVTEIGANAFFGCSSLESVAIPSGVSSIGPGAFEYCTGLMEISFPVSLRSIGNSAFSECVNLERVTFESGLISIGPSAFKNCSNLFEVSLPDSLTSIGGEAFSGDFNLTIISIPDSAHLTGPKAFTGCNKLLDSQGFIILDDSLLLQYTGQQNNINIPDTVTKIADYAFYGYFIADNSSAPVGVDITGPVTSIGDFAFAAWENPLFGINIPSSVTSISLSAFYGTQTPPEWEISENFVILNGILTNYIGSDPNPVIPDSVTSIGFGAFYQRTALRSVKFSSQLTTIGEEAFAGCTNLTDILGPSGSTFTVKYFYDTDHIENSGLYSISLPETIQNIGTNAFSRTSIRNLEFLPPDFVLPDSSVTIEQEAFSGIAATYVVVPYSVDTIGARAFAGCTELRAVYFTGRNCIIANDTFEGCGSLVLISHESSGSVSNVHRFANAHGFQFINIDGIGN